MFMYVYLCACVHSVYRVVGMSVFVCVYPCVCVCICVCGCLCVWPCACAYTCVVVYVCCARVCVCVCLCIVRAHVSVCSWVYVFVMGAGYGSTIPRVLVLHSRRSSRDIRNMQDVFLGILVGSPRICADIPAEKLSGAFAKFSRPYVHFSKLSASPWPFWQTPHFAFRRQRDISLEIQGLNRLISLNKSPQPSPLFV